MRTTAACGGNSTNVSGEKRLWHPPRPIPCRGSCRGYRPALAAVAARSACGRTVVGRAQSRQDIDRAVSRAQRWLCFSAPEAGEASIERTDRTEREIQVVVLQPEGPLQLRHFLFQLHQSVA